MMRKSIIRTMTVTTIDGYKLNVENEAPSVENIKFSVVGKLTKNECEKALKKEYGLGVQLKAYFHETATYEISIDDFMKYATRLED